MLKVKRELLMRELVLLSLCAERKTTIPVLSFMLIETFIGKARLTATDLDVTISSELEVENISGEMKAFCVPLARLASLVKLSDGDEVVFTLEKNGWVVFECGSSRQRIPSIKPEEFPQTPNPSGASFDVSSVPLAEMFGAIQLALSRESNDKPEYWDAEMKLQDDVVGVTATDGFVLAHAERAFAGNDFSVLIPKRAVAVGRQFFEDAKTLTVSENHLTAKAATRIFTARLSTNRFPQWERLVPKDGLRTLDLPTTLPVALRRACLSTDRFSYVRQVFGDGKLTIKAKGSEEGEATETLPCEGVDGNGFEMGVNAKHMLEVLRQTGDAVIEVGDTKKPYLVKPKVTRTYELFYVLVPVRLDRI